MKKFDIGMLIAFILIVLSILLLLTSASSMNVKGLIGSCIGGSIAYLIIYSQKNKLKNGEQSI
jgi:hypothetical protein